MQQHLQPIEWRDEYSIGVADIDLQHQRLLFLLNKLNTLIEAGNVARSRILLDLLDDFNDYATYHFLGEEELMKGHLPAGEAMSQHLAAHQSYWTNIPAMTERYKGGDSAAAMELVEFLNRWWVNHILVTDKRMGRELNQHGVQ